MDKIKDFLEDGGFDDGEIESIIAFIKTLSITDLTKEYYKYNLDGDVITDFMKEHLKYDDILLGWHSNIACWFLDNLCIVDYDTRNKLAQKFIKRFFDIDYDWVKLVNPDNRTYSIDEKLMKGEKSHESK